MAAWQEAQSCLPPSAAPGVSQTSTDWGFQSGNRDSFLPQATWWLLTTWNVLVSLRNFCLL